MDLLQQLADAVLVAASDDASPEEKAVGKSQVHLQLQQLTASISALQRTYGNAGASSDHAAQAVLTSLEQVQGGLNTSCAEISSLLAYFGRGPCPAVQPHPNTQAHSTPWQQRQQQLDGSQGTSRTTLCHLLQLAVHHSCCSVSTRSAANHDDAAAVTSSGAAALLLPGLQCTQQTPQPPGQQQQRWCRAAQEAVQLFSFAELVQLPPGSLEQALLLHPCLLEDMLQAAAAAVMRPILQSDQPTQHPGSATAVLRRAALGGGGRGILSSSTAHSMQDLLDVSCPWMHWLPKTLAYNPVLMLKASTTLLSWLEASGHSRVWQLLTLTCRPAWQQLAPAACASSLSHPRAHSPCSGRTHAAGGEAAELDMSAAAGTDFGPTDTTTHDSLTADHGMKSLSGAVLLDDSGVTSMAQRLVMSGALQLLCPQQWQQDLVCVLVTEPSANSLLLLLQQLPGVAWPRQMAGADEPAANTRCKQLSHSMGLQTPHQLVCHADLQSWPDAEAWQHTPHVSASAADSLHDEPDDGPTGAPWGRDGSQASAAWGLVMQHSCWYHFACAVLVQLSLSHLQQQHQQRHEVLQIQQPSGGATWLGEVQALLQSSRQGLLQQQHLSDMHLAACCAALIAWVQEPCHWRRQARLRDLLLQAYPAGAARRDPEKHPSPQPACVLDTARSLVQLWKTCWQPARDWAPQQNKAASASHLVASSSDGCLPFSAVFATDLPCALLQQKQLLLACTPDDLVQLSWYALSVQPAASAAGIHVDDDAQNGQDQHKGAQQPPHAAVCQLLDCSDSVCAAALEVVKLAMEHQLQPQQQPVPCSVQHDLKGTLVSWRARQWLQAQGHLLGVAGQHSSCNPRACQLDPMLDASVAKQLLAAATGVNERVKQLAAVTL